MAFDSSKLTLLDDQAPASRPLPPSFASKLTPMEVPQQKPGIFSRVKDVFKQEYGRLEKKANEAVDAMAGGQQTGVETVFQVGAGAAGSGARAVARTVWEGIKSLTPDQIEKAVSESVAKGIAASDIPAIMADIMPRVAKFKEEHPRAARNITAGLDVAETASTIALGNKVEAWLKKNVPKIATEVSTKAKSLLPTGEWQSAKQAELRKLLEEGTPDARVAGLKLEEPPAAFGDGPGAALNTKRYKVQQILTDRPAKEVIRQGVPEDQVALIKLASPSDKKKMLSMIDTRVAQTTNARIMERASDVPGETFVKQLAKPLEKMNRQAASMLDDVADDLAGQAVDVNQQVVDFSDDLSRAGVSVSPQGKLDFTGSSFDNLPGPQKALENAWSRLYAANETGDALEIHRLKKYIDEIVTYGDGGATGLKGSAQHMLKSLRHNLDSTLDAAFPDYNAVNTVYATTRNELDSLRAAIGPAMDLKDTFASAGVGTKLRALFSNSQSRATILQAIDQAQKTAKMLGIDITDDIVTQAKFADILETAFGTEAHSGLLGNLEKGANAAAAVGQAASGSPTGLVRGAAALAKSAYDATAGINRDALVKALRALLK